MKSRKWMQGFVAGAVLGAAGMVVFASGAFAGWVVEMESAQQTGPFLKQGASNINTKITMKIQDKMMRTDYVGMSMIHDSEKGDVVVLRHGEKKYLRVSGEKIALARAGGVAPVAAAASGNKDKINGYDVEEYAAQLPDRKLTCWVSKDGADAEKIRQAMANVYGNASASPMGSIDYKSLPGYPIRMVTHVQAHTMSFGDGRTREVPEITITSTVSSIKEEKVDEALFKTPEEYTEMVLPQAADKK